MVGVRKLKFQGWVLWTVIPYNIPFFSEHIISSCYFVCCKVIFLKLIWCNILKKQVSKQHMLIEHICSWSQKLTTPLPPPPPKKPSHITVYEHFGILYCLITPLGLTLRFLTDKCRHLIIPQESSFDSSHPHLRCWLKISFISSLPLRAAILIKENLNLH